MHDFSALPCGIIIVNAQGRITYTNPAAEQILGRSANFMNGKSIKEFFPQELLPPARQSIRHHGFFLERPMQSVAEVNLHFAPWDNDGIVLVVEEVGLPRKMAQHDAQKDAAQKAGTMAAMLAHEVKNPLAGIRGAAQLLEQTSQAADQKMLHLIISEVDRINALITDMEWLSGDSGAAGYATLNIHEILDYTRQVAAKTFASAVTITDHYDPSLPAVWGNRDHLAALFLNLLKNAGEALVDTSNARIHIETRYHGDYRMRGADGSLIQLPIRVRVEDNGPGIPTPIRAALFEPFVSQKSGGKGLGLAIVRKIALDHGGVVECHASSTLGGARFDVLLPVQQGVLHG